MEIKVKMPPCLAPRLTEIAVSEGDGISIGDILFSYESDGALFFEYSACAGRVSSVTDQAWKDIRVGDTVLTVEGNAPKEFKFYNHL